MCRRPCGCNALKGVQVLKKPYCAQRGCTSGAGIVREDLIRVDIGISSQNTTIVR